MCYVLYENNHLRFQKSFLRNNFFSLDGNFFQILFISQSSGISHLSQGDLQYFPSSEHVSHQVFVHMLYIGISSEVVTGLLLSDQPEVSSIILP